MQKINNLTVDIQTPPRLTFRGGRKGTSRVKVRVHLPDKGAVIYCVLCELVLWAVRRLAKCVHWLVASWEDRRLLRLHQLPTSPHTIARVLLERRCCGKYLSFSCQVQYPVSCSFSCDTLPVPDQTYGAIWISFPFESICCQDTFIRSIDNYILKAHCQPFLIQICGLTDKTCRQISQTSDLPRWCWPNINNRPSKYTKLWGGSITNSLNKRINFQRWKTKGSKKSALWENDGQGNSKSKTWDIQIFRPSDRPWGENRYNFEKLNDKSPGSLQDWKSFQKWQIWINKWILWLQGMYNLGQKLFVGICHLISTDCPNLVSFWGALEGPRSSSLWRQ